MITIEKVNKLESELMEVKKGFEEIERKATDFLKEIERMENRRNSIKFDSESFINEMESINGVEDTPISYEEYEEQQYSQMSERELRGDF